MIPQTVMTLKLDTDLLPPPAKLQASLWMSQRFLLTPKELEELFATLPCFHLYSLSHVGSKEGFYLTRESFLECYSAYFRSLFEKKDVSFYKFKKQLTVAMTCESETLYLTEPAKDTFLIHIQKPTLVIGPCIFHYDASAKKIMYADHKTKAIRLGIEIKFPQFYQDPVTLQPVKHFTDPNNSNTKLFKALQKWGRNHTKVVFLENKESHERFSPACKVGHYCLAEVERCFDVQSQRYTAAF